MGFWTLFDPLNVLKASDDYEIKILFLVYPISYISGIFNIIIILITKSNNVNGDNDPVKSTADTNG